jgi:uncharacterized protein YcbX
MGPIFEGDLRVRTLHRYPVKSMLGETVDVLPVHEGGAHGDRVLALIDRLTGRVASAKQARLWRGLLQCTATLGTSGVRIEMPDGTRTAFGDRTLDDRLSQHLGRAVNLIDSRPTGASVERADPEQVLDRGVEADVDAPLLELAQATLGDSFVDFAPLHAITTATLNRVGVEAARYRPNVVVAAPDGYPAYAENDWVGRLLRIGGVTLRVMGPTPRCVIPTLEHGPRPRAPHALRTPVAENRVEAFNFGVLPCAGAYLEVVSGGTLRAGDRIEMC